MRSRSWWLGFGVVCLVAACGDELPRDRRLGEGWQPPGDDAGADDAGVDAGQVSAGPTCVPARASEPLPAREVAMMRVTGGENAGVFTSELYGQFVDYCGSCHTQGRNQGGFDVSRTTFVDKIRQEVLDRARSNDPDEVMPPMSVPFAMRDPQAPIVRFVNLLTEWYAAGKPDDVFYPAGEDAQGGGASPYTLKRDVGMSLTNIGDCVPNKTLVLGGDHDAARALDDKFAAVRTFADLPKRLEQTDITTLDGAALAAQGVIAFAPTYTLWADYAKKIRFIRVPVGTSVRFDADTQSFEIPENTRFYKTFFKPVIDRQGQQRYRKMETRLILSRPDRVREDGTLEHTAIFATYKWNDDETEAVLHEVPYRDGGGFTDDLRVYVVDERLEDQIVRQAPPDLDQALLAAGARRTYPMPGADRCINCHMGSKNFVLGFTPLQVKRRPLGEGGVIEPAVGDELNQLQRLIDYGVISGIQSPDDVVGLEDSQGARRPRNVHELNAQGYMVGNCAHCHNPRGLPSRREAALRDALNFAPSAQGGIFQFPLDRFSPRTFRGTAQDIRVPYITPSLFDHPDAVASNDENTGAISLSNKWITLLDPSAQQQAGFEAIRQLQLRSAIPMDPNEAANPLLIPRRYPTQFDAQNLSPGRPLLAPWRSLLYRNVDAPFSYEDGGTIYPRMPMDTPGYDCRVRRLMGTWMVSIPSRHKPRPTPELPPGTRLLRYAGLDHYDELFGVEEQPYEEAFAGDDDYAQRVSEAEARVRTFQQSERYHDCPAPELDGMAPEVTSGRSVLPLPQVTTIADAQGTPIERYDLLSPGRPHYPKTDLRDDPRWVIRRPDWVTVLEEERVDPIKAASTPLIALTSEQTIAAVREIVITPALEDALLTPMPFGLWVNKPACADTLSDVPRVADFANESRPSWMDVSDAPSDAPVYMASAGAQVFDMICSRCHDAQGTGKSALATTIADLTGGLTRVANLRDGLFGPPGAAGMAWQDEFDQAAGDGVDARDWGARYVAWMGLGGTNAQIPATVLTRLRSSEVLGERPQSSRFKPSAADAANMLTVVKLACEVFVPAFSMGLDPHTGRFVRESDDPNDGNTLARRGLITRNGVADLWERLCHLDNPGPVRRVEARIVNNDLRLVVDASYYATPSDTRAQTYFNVLRRDVYPSDAWVGDWNGGITRGVQADNAAPWCLATIADNDPQGAVKRMLVAQLAQELDRSIDDLPWCPTQAVASSARWSVADASRWAIRGAANAGVAVFLYLDALARGQVQPNTPYDRCEERR